MFGVLSWKGLIFPLLYDDYLGLFQNLNSRGKKLTLRLIFGLFSHLSFLVQSLVFRLKWPFFCSCYLPSRFVKNRLCFGRVIVLDSLSLLQWEMQDLSYNILVFCCPSCSWNICNQHCSEVLMGPQAQAAVFAFLPWKCLHCCCLSSCLPLCGYIRLSLCYISFCMAQEKGFYPRALMADFFFFKSKWLVLAYL